MRVLSLFDGISCAKVALDRAGIPVDIYYASEIDRYAMNVSYKNNDDLKKAWLGDIKGILNIRLFGQHLEIKDIDINGASVGILNWNEVERLQGLPDGYTDLGKDNREEKRGAVLGNAFNVDVVAHILSCIPKH